MNSRYIWPEVLRREKVVSLRSWYHYPVTDPMVRKSLQFGGPDLQVAQIAPVLLNCSSTVAHIVAHRVKYVQLCHNHLAICHRRFICWDDTQARESIRNHC